VLGRDALYRQMEGQVCCQQVSGCVGMGKYHVADDEGEGGSCNDPVACWQRLPVLVHKLVVPLRGRMGCDSC
jgi:hypothetical protein